MSNEEPVRSVPDEMFQQVTAKAGRQLPDALFGPPPARPARNEREEPIRSVPDELFQRVTARSTRSLPDALFGPVPPPAVVAPEPVDPEADAAGSGSGTADSVSSAHDGSSEEARSAGSSVISADDEAGVGIAPSSGAQDADSATSGAVELGDSDAVVAGPDTAQPAVEVAQVDAVSDADSAVFTVEPFADAGASVDPAQPQPQTPDPSVSGADATTATGDPETPSPAVEAAVDEVGPAVVRADLPAASAAPADSLLGTSTATDANLAVDSVSPPAPQGETAGAAAPGSSLVAEGVSPQPVEPAAPRPVLLVIADSLAYYGPKGGLPADDPRIWPNIVAAELDWDVELIARIGWTCRDAYWALIGDPRVWAAVPRAGAVVFAVGGMDTLPSPLPTALREMIRYIRPPRLRRGVRASYNWLQPKLSKLGRPVALPPRISVDYLDQSRTALNHLRPELPVVAVLPSVHKCDAYGRVHRGRARAVKALQAWSDRTSVPLVDLGAAVRDDIESDSANPDGIHWGWAGHAAVATAMSKALQEVR